MTEDFNEDNANERPEEVYDIPKVYVPPNEEVKIISQICKNGHKLTELVSAKILKRKGTNFPNKICNACEETAFGSLIVEVDKEWTRLSNLTYDEVGTQLVSEIIQKSCGVAATEDYTQATALEGNFANIKKLQGGFLVQPHWLSREGRNLTSSNYTDLRSTLTGFSRGNRGPKVEFLRGSSLDGKLVEALLVQSIKNSGSGKEGVQFVQSVIGPDGVESDMFTKGDAYLEDCIDNVMHPVEMFLGGAIKILPKIQKKMAQLASVVRASGADSGYLMFIEYLHYDKESSRFGLVRLHADDLMDWADREVADVTMLYDAVRHLIEDDPGSREVVA